MKGDGEVLIHVFNRKPTRAVAGDRCFHVFCDPKKDGISEHLEVELVSEFQPPGARFWVAAPLPFSPPFRFRQDYKSLD